MPEPTIRKIVEYIFPIFNEGRVTEVFTCPMPQDAVVLGCEVRGNWPVLWAMVGPGEVRDRPFRVVAHREPFDASKLRYVGKVAVPPQDHGSNYERLGGTFYVLEAIS